jgi:hypothetical protein
MAAVRALLGMLLTAAFGAAGCAPAGDNEIP